MTDGYRINPEDCYDLLINLEMALAHTLYCKIYEAYNSDGKSMFARGLYLAGRL